MHTSWGMWTKPQQTSPIHLVESRPSPLWQFELSSQCPIAVDRILGMALLPHQLAKYSPNKKYL
eukprot:4967371-Amphidinium_carterae.1